MRNSSADRAQSVLGLMDLSVRVRGFTFCEGSSNSGLECTGRTSSIAEQIVDLLTERGDFLPERGDFLPELCNRGFQLSNSVFVGGFIGAAWIVLRGRARRECILGSNRRLD